MSSTKYLKSSSAVFTELEKVKTKGALCKELAKATGYTVNTIGHAILVLKRAGKVRQKLASGPGERCTNRQRYYSTQYAPEGAVAGLQGKVTPDEACAAPRFSIDWPPGFVSRIVVSPATKRFATQAEMAAYHRGNGGFDRHRI